MTDSETRHIEIVEMSPRDGLQNEPGLVSTRDKIALIDALARCGFQRIEATSFVSPKRVPQLGDGAAVLEGIAQAPAVAFGALTPNMRGLNGALAARADWVAVFASATEAFSQANLNCSVAESLERFGPVCEAARERGVPVRGYVSCVIADPYSGPSDPADVARVTEALFAMGCHEVSLGDTTGRGTPDTVDAMLQAVLRIAPADRLAGHFHDTDGNALLNVAAAAERGLRVFDASVGGLGGCPFAPGAKGNVDTLVVDAWAREAGFQTGLDRLALEQAASVARGTVARGLVSREAGSDGEKGAPSP